MRQQELATNQTNNKLGNPSWSMEELEVLASEIKPYILPNGKVVVGGKKECAAKLFGASKLPSYRTEGAIRSKLCEMYPNVAKKKKTRATKKRVSFTRGYVTQNDIVTALERVIGKEALQRLRVSDLAGPQEMDKIYGVIVPTHCKDFLRREARKSKKTLEAFTGEIIEQHLKSMGVVQ